MIEMNYQQLSSEEFTVAMRKLAANPMDVKTAYQITKIAQELTQIRKKVSESYQKDILEKFAKRDEKGDVIFPVDVPEEKQAEFEQAREDFGKTPVRIDRYKLTLDQLSQIKISPADLSVLELIVEAPVVETAQVLSLK